MTWAELHVEARVEKNAQREDAKSRLWQEIVVEDRVLDALVKVATCQALCPGVSSLLVCLHQGMEERLQEKRGSRVRCVARGAVGMVWDAGRTSIPVREEIQSARSL